MRSNAVKTIDLDFALSQQCENPTIIVTVQVS